MTGKKLGTYSHCHPSENGQRRPFFLIPVSSLYLVSINYCMKKVDTVKWCGMDQNLPTIQNLRHWIKALTVQREAIEKQIEAYQSAILAQESKTSNKQAKRKRSKTPETIKLEQVVEDIFRKKGEDSLKQAEILRALVERSAPEEQMTPNKMQGKFNNLKKSGFLVSAGQYGYYQLSGAPTKRNMENNQ